MLVEVPAQTLLAALAEKAHRAGDSLRDSGEASKEVDFGYFAEKSYKQVYSRLLCDCRMRTLCLR